MASTRRSQLSFVNFSLVDASSTSLLHRSFEQFMNWTTGIDSQILFELWYCNVSSSSLLDSWGTWWWKLEVQCLYSTPSWSPSHRSHEDTKSAPLLNKHRNPSKSLEEKLSFFFLDTVNCRKFVSSSKVEPNSGIVEPNQQQTMTLTFRRFFLVVLKRCNPNALLILIGFSEIWDFCCCCPNSLALFFRFPNWVPIGFSSWRAWANLLFTFAGCHMCENLDKYIFRGKSWLGLRHQVMSVHNSIAYHRSDWTRLPASMSAISRPGDKLTADKQKILCGFSAIVPSKKLTYPTLGEGSSFSKCLGRGYVSSLDGICNIL